MKTLRQWITYCSLLFVLGLVSAQASLNDGLVAYYPFENNTSDASGNGLHGTGYGDISYSPGLSGQGVKLDGVDDYIDLPVSELIPQTLVAWIKPDASAATNFMTIIDSDQCNHYGQGIEISYPGLVRQQFQVDTHNKFLETGKPVALDQWQQVAAVYTNGDVSFFHNGALVKSMSFTQNALDGKNYTIGNHCRPGSGHFKGFIDDVSLYNRALSATDIQQLYANNENSSAVSTQNCSFGQLSMGTSDWSQPSANNALIENSNEGLLLHGSVWKNGKLDTNGFTDGNAVVSTPTFNHIGTTSYIKLKIQSDNKYLAIQAKPNGMPIKLLTTHHSWAGSDVLPEDTWLYIRTSIANNGQWNYIISSNGYDDAGGSIMYSYSGTFNNEQLQSFDAQPFLIAFVDNYGGVNTSVTIAETVTNCIAASGQPVDPALACSPEQLDLCLTPGACYFDGLGNWCNGACSSSACPVIQERSQCSEFDLTSNLLYISCLIVGENAYQADLSLFSVLPVQFKVDNIRNFAGDAINSDCSEFNLESNILHISCLNVDKNTYWVDINLTSLDPLLFGVQGLGDKGLQTEQIIKSIDINVDNSEPLVMTIIDINDRYYRFYGVKDANNQAQYYDRLVLDQFDSQGKFNHYMMLTFDQLSRLTGLILAEGEGQLGFEYLGDAKLRVTAKAFDGTQETVIVDDPFSSLARFGPNKSLTPSTRISEFDTTIKAQYVGGIQACDENSPPEVSIKRNFNAVLQARYPLLARSFSAERVSLTDKDSRDEDNPENFNYLYSITVPGKDYADWKWQCRKDYAWDVGSGMLGTPVAVISAIGGVLKDITAGSAKNTTKTITDTASDKLSGGVPVFSSLRKVYEASQREGALDGQGICSQRFYNMLHQTLLHEQTITVKDGDHTKTAVYRPVVRWHSNTKDFLQLAPSIDFSELCNQVEDNTTSGTCDKEVVKNVTNSSDCADAHGSWTTGGLHYSNYGYCFCW